MSRRNPFEKDDLRRYYFINLEIGLIVTLLLFLGLFKVDLNPQSEVNLQTDKQEVVQMEEVVRTEQQNKVAAPPKPAVPIEVPNDEILEEEMTSFESELDLGASLDLPKDPPKSAEEEESGKDEVFVVVERMPELKGGLASLQSKIEYPEIARKAGIEGRVIVQFVVTERGTVQNPKVVRGIGGGCDEEALRVVKKAKFTPGLQRGRPVKVQYTLPIVFRLSRAD